MLPKEDRFTSRLFDAKFKKSRSFRWKDCLFLVSSDNDRSHCAVVVSKKVAKLAVRRNRIRRQIYELLRFHLYKYLRKQNVICLYKGDQIFQNSQDFVEGLGKLRQFLSRSPNKASFSRHR